MEEQPTRRKKKRGISKAQVEAQHNGRVLQIYEHEEPLTQLQCGEVIEQILDDHIAMLAIQQPVEVSSKCEFLGLYVGQGTCLAKKFMKYGVSRDIKCASCKSNTITNQLNYIFRHCFGDKYRAEWRQKKERRSRKKKEE
jgi:hypothetical protein